MARFYLHLFNSLGFVPDREGKELPGLAAARDDAVISIRSIIAEDVKQGRVDLRGRIEIANATQEVLAVVPFTDAVNLRLKDGE